MPPYLILIEWIELATQLRNRVLKPGSRPTAFFYLLLAVAAFGGTGLLGHVTSCEL